MRRSSKLKNNFVIVRNELGKKSWQLRSEKNLFVVIKSIQFIAMCNQLGKRRKKNRMFINMFRASCWDHHLVKKKFNIKVKHYKKTWYFFVGKYSKKVPNLNKCKKDHSIILGKLILTCPLWLGWLFFIGPFD
jgi:hypothetical protein